MCNVTIWDGRGKNYNALAFTQESLGSLTKCFAFLLETQTFVRKHKCIDLCSQLAPRSESIRMIPNFWMVVYVTSQINAFMYMKYIGGFDFFLQQQKLCTWSRNVRLHFESHRLCPQWNWCPWDCHNICTLSSLHIQTIYNTLCTVKYFWKKKKRCNESLKLNPNL